MTGSPLQFDRLLLSQKQECVPNPDPATQNWPQIFKWTDDLMMLAAVDGMLKRLRECDPVTQRDFWDGKVAKQYLEGLPARLAKYSTPQIVEFGRVWLSRDGAMTRLITKARREKFAANKSEGEFTLDAGTYALRLAEQTKRVNVRVMPLIVKRAAEENDVRFFIRLGKVLQSKHRPPEVDWSRCSPLACFLVQNWCRPTDYKLRLPALCQFTDQALADFCSVALGRRPGNPSAGTIRQWRRRLGLKQTKRPAVRKLTVKGDELHFG